MDRAKRSLETTWTPKKHNQKCPDCGKEYYIDWTVEERTYL
jgi:hypothetical protein